MRELLIKQGERTALIEFIETTNSISIVGKSVPEDPKSFWNPILEWVNEYIETNPQNVVLRFDLEYFNTSSSKYILEFFRLFNNYVKLSSNSVKVEWYYEEDDDDMYDAGLDYSSILKYLPFNHIKT